MKIKFLLCQLAVIFLLLGSKQASGQCSVTTTPYHYYYSWNGWTIDAFTLNGVASNNPGTVSNAYNSFSTPVRTLELGQTYNWTASIGMQWYGQVFAIWIDLDGNNQFDAAEMLVSTTYSYTPARSGTLTIPTTAVPGANRKMRIRSAQSYWSQFTGTMACTSYPVYGYGETEDYIVNLCSQGSVTSHPTDKESCPGGSVMFNAGGTNIVSRQWQVNTGGGWANISNGGNYSGATTGTLSVTNIPASFNNYKYRCRLSDNCNTVHTTNEANLKTFAQVEVGKQTAAVQICKWAQTEMFARPKDTATSYRWQMGTFTNGYTDVPNQYPFVDVDSPTLKIVFTEDNLNGLSFRCIMEDPCGLKDTSADIPFVVVTGPHVEEDPKDDTTQPYNNGQFEVGVYGHSYETYWQASTDGGAHFSNINDNGLYFGTKSNTLTINSAIPSHTGMKFRAIIKSTDPDCGFYNDTSEVGTLYVGNYTSVKSVAAEDISISLYPNPAAGNTVYLHSEKALGKTQAVVTDKLGKVVYTGNIDMNGQDAAIQIGSLAPGVYTINVSDADNNVLNTLKFTKQ